MRVETVVDGGQAVGESPDLALEQSSQTILRFIILLNILQALELHLNHGFGPAEIGR